MYEYIPSDQYFLYARDTNGQAMVSSSSNWFGLGNPEGGSEFQKGP
jgi:hypothetical protein